MVDILERALAAGRESRRIAIRAAFDPLSLVRDVAALANSGGGAIVVRGDVKIDRVVDAFRSATDSDFRDVRLERGVIVVGESFTPIVIDGVIYVRRGAKTAPATTDDVSKMIDRRVAMVRKAWLSAVREVVKPDSPVAAATGAVRVVTDPRAPAFRLVDYDKTHPFRQKEVLAVLRERMPERNITPFDLLAVRKVHEIDRRPDFVHKPAFGSNQYSVRFVDWLQLQIGRDPDFLPAARQEYQRSRRTVPSASV